MIEEDLIFNLECVTNVLFFVKLLAKLNPMMFKHFMYEIVTYLNNLNRRSSVIDGNKIHIIQITNSEFAIRIFTMMSEGLLINVILYVIKKIMRNNFANC